MAITVRKGMLMNMAERALALKYDSDAVLNTPMAMLLPAPAREILRRQAAIIAELAHEVHRMSKAESDVGEGAQRGE